MLGCHKLLHRPFHLFKVGIMFFKTCCSFPLSLPLLHFCLHSVFVVSSIRPITSTLFAYTFFLLLKKERVNNSRCSHIFIMDVFRPQMIS
ncbi:hypothetical protein BCR41DRAFT_344515 [Lobosporangium transversale]|uniref:Uncharacterized protein n=1 Tax=Lobosporangium transversale TaxID=64571 RepID=A0A1Y2H3E6_9FUNG|nr:hypothetical protein BCR41DRAFT_344515 [Lobosporangium transversale]ORZ29080.1 hypothetical protein BCR41DRAFT_344515 [Lobosporangium transversale]|eukprot:XP_021886753.1 hypothetical protein BCR41DRAFT_344515 [Lobosporangium transversale]